MAPGPASQQVNDWQTVTPNDWQTVPAPKKAAAPQEPGNHFGDIIGDAIKNGPQRFMDFLSNHPYEDLKNHAGEMADKAKAAFKSGDTSTGMGYLMAAFIPGSGDEAVKAGEEFGSGNPSGGFGHSVLALAPFLAPELATKAEPYVSAAIEGGKAAVPDVLAGSAKIAAGEIASKIPGIGMPARIALQYPGMRQIAKAPAKGMAAFRTALDRYKAPDVVGPVAPAPNAPESTPVAEPTTPVEAPPASAAPAKTPGQVYAEAEGHNWDKLTLANKQMMEHIAQAKANMAAPVSPAAAVPTPAAPPANQPASISSALALPSSAAPRAPLQPPLARPTPPPTSSATIAEALRQQMLESGTLDPTKEAAAEPTASGPVPQAPLDAGMRGLPSAVRKPAADANYRAQKESGAGVPGAQAYEAAARANKVDPLVDHLTSELQKNGISAADAQTLQDPQFKPHWAALAHDLGIKPPSQTTIGQVLEELKKREAQPK